MGLTSQTQSAKFTLQGMDGFAGAKLDLKEESVDRDNLPAVSNDGNGAFPVTAPPVLPAIVEKTTISADDLLEKIQNDVTNDEDDFLASFQVDEDEVVVDTVSPNSDINYVTRSEDSEIFLEILLDDRRTILDLGMHAFLLDEHTVLPLRDFVTLVDFPITVDTSTGVATGWFLKPENTFRLSYPYEFIEIAGKKIPLDQRGIVETHLDDIYVSLDLLSSWFPTELTLNYNELRLYMRTLVDLPFQERAKRYSRWEASRLSKDRSEITPTYDPEKAIRFPYRLYSAPSLGMSHGFNVSQPNVGSSAISTNHSLNGQGDLFGLSGRFSLGYTTSSTAKPQFGASTITLSKDEYGGSLLGRLQATHYEIGDVSSSASVPLAGSATGRGFVVHNEPYNFVSDPTQFRIDGFGPVGWDVEVFQDVQLLAFGKVDDAGRFDFEALPLSEGYNLFKIVLYGPNGEKEERFERFYLGQSMVEKGKFVYNAAYIQSSTPVLNLTPTPSISTDPTYSLVGEYGLTDYLSVRGGYHQSAGDSNSDGIGLGLRASSRGVYAQMQTFLASSGGKTSSLLLAGNLSPKTRLNVQHINHTNYDASVHTTIRSTGLQMSTLFTFKGDILPDINTTIGITREKEVTGREKLSLNGRFGANFFGLSLSNEMQRDSFSDGTADVYEGRLNMRKRIGRNTLRGTVSYTFHQPFEATSANWSWQRDLTKNVGLSFAMSHTFGVLPVTSYTTDLSWKLKKMKLGMSGSWDTNKDKTLSMTMNYSLVPQKVYGHYGITDVNESASEGRVMVRPYIDRNLNNVFDKGEDIVQAVSFRNANRGRRSTRTDSGMILVGGLTSGQVSRIIVEEKSIEDVYLIPAQKEILVMGKTGTNGPVDFAFRKLGTISGTVFVASEEDDNTVLEGVQIILLDVEGNEVTDTYTEYDGFFSFESIPVGTYELFFPASEALLEHYNGDGQGPKVELNFDNPELIDVGLRVERDTFVLDLEYTDSPGGDEEWWNIEYDDEGNPVSNDESSENDNTEEAFTDFEEGEAFDESENVDDLPDDFEMMIDPNAL